MMGKTPPPAPKFSTPAVGVTERVEQARERRVLIAVIAATLALLLALLLFFLVLRIWHGDGTFAHSAGGAGLESSQERAEHPRMDEETSAGESQLDPHVSDRPMTEGELNREAAAASGSPVAAQDQERDARRPLTAGPERRAADAAESDRGTDPSSMAPHAAASDAALQGPPANSGRRYLTMPGGSFFGLKADGNRFVYVVDRSGSMSGLRLQRAKDEVQRSVGTLTPEQSFYVIFFNTSPLHMFAPRGNPEAKSLDATSENVTRLIEWLPIVNSNGGTDPESSLMAALRLNPNAIFFLTDGQFAAQIVDRITAINRGRVQINTVSFVEREAAELLRRFADQNRGRYIHVP